MPYNYCIPVIKSMMYLNVNVVEFNYVKLAEENMKLMTLFSKCVRYDIK